VDLKNEVKKRRREIKIEVAGTDPTLVPRKAGTTCLPRAYSSVVVGPKYFAPSKSSNICNHQVLPTSSHPTLPPSYLPILILIQSHSSLSHLPSSSLHHLMNRSYTPIQPPLSGDHTFALFQHLELSSSNLRIRTFAHVISDTRLCNGS
jgi:hypothetical protein